MISNHVNTDMEDSWKEKSRDMGKFNVSFVYCVSCVRCFQLHRDQQSWVTWDTVVWVPRPTLLSSQSGNLTRVNGPNLPICDLPYPFPLQLIDMCLVLSWVTTHTFTKLVKWDFRKWSQTFADIYVKVALFEGKRVIKVNNDIFKTIFLSLSQIQIKDHFVKRRDF